MRTHYLFHLNGLQGTRGGAEVEMLGWEAENTYQHTKLKKGTLNIKSIDNKNKMN